jgi:hypothetical protein
MAQTRFANDDNENHNQHCTCRRLPFVHRPSLGAGAWADVAGGAVTARMSMDIVIRLRKETSPLMHDAAREIERLLAALIYIRDNGEYMSGTSCADHANTALEQNGDK